MCEQNTLSKLYGNLLQTSSLWHRADRGTTRSARDPSSHTPAGAPQDDIVFLAGGFAPCTPIREREHRCLTIIVQFDILFFHIQVCQQSEIRLGGFFIFMHSSETLKRLRMIQKNKKNPKWSQACGIPVPLGETKFGFIRIISQKQNSANGKSKKSPRATTDKRYSERWTTSSALTSFPLLV